jgi:hypothetical protein
LCKLFIWKSNKCIIKYITNFEKKVTKNEHQQRKNNLL